MTKGQTAIIKGIIEKATPILPEGEKIAVRYVDLGGNYKAVKVELRRSSFSIHFALDFIVNPSWKHPIETIGTNPEFILTLSSLKYNDIPEEYRYNTIIVINGKEYEGYVDSRYVKAYKTFLSVLFKDNANTMFDYTLDRYFDYDEIDYFGENDFTSKTDNCLGYRIDRTWTSAYGTEFYFNK